MRFPDFSKLPNVPLTSDETRSIQRLAVICLILGASAWLYWFLFVTEKSNFNLTFLEILGLVTGTLFPFMGGGILISFRIFKPITVQKMFFLLWISMMLGSAVFGFIIINLTA
jgi:hypothetical protein